MFAQGRYLTSVAVRCYLPPSQTVPLVDIHRPSPRTIRHKRHQTWTKKYTTRTPASQLEGNVRRRARHVRTNPHPTELTCLEKCISQFLSSPYKIPAPKAKTYQCCRHVSVSSRSGKLGGKPPLEKKTGPGAATRLDMNYEAYDLSKLA